jgi:hypothetical protein
MVHEHPHSLQPATLLSFELPLEISTSIAQNQNVDIKVNKNYIHHVNTETRHKPPLPGQYLIILVSIAVFLINAVIQSW